MSTRIRPVVYVWTGEHMMPLPRFTRQCNEQFVVGEEYPLTILEARSRATHNHYFATLQEIWRNLPEKIAPRFPSYEHLRKWCLVQCGYSTERNFVCDTPDHAMRLAAFVRSVDTYAVIKVSDEVVQIFDAKSQSAAAMGKDDFRDSKNAVLELASSLTGTKSVEFKKEASKQFRPEPKRDENP